MTKTLTLFLGWGESIKFSLPPNYFLLLTPLDALKDHNYYPPNELVWQLCKPTQSHSRYPNDTGFKFNIYGWLRKPYPYPTLTRSSSAAPRRGRRRRPPPSPAPLISLTTSLAGGWNLLKRMNTSQKILTLNICRPAAASAAV